MYVTNLIKGSKHSKETLERLRISHLGQKPHNLGKKMSKEAVEKMRLAKLGKKLPPFSEEHKQKISLAHIGKYVSEETRQKLRAINLGKVYPTKHGVNHHGWKGDNVGNNALHEYVRKYLPEPEVCDFCHENKKLDLANFTGVYNRDFTNWKYLCRSCHINYDRNGVIPCQHV